MNRERHVENFLRMLQLASSLDSTGRIYEMSSSFRIQLIRNYRKPIAMRVDYGKFWLLRRLEPHQSPHLDLPSLAYLTAGAPASA